MSGALRVLPIAAAFGLPAGLLGSLAGAVVGSDAAGLALALVATVAVAAGVARERRAPQHVAVAAILLGLLSATAFFLWGAVTFDD
jgi:hypothetical protein